MIHPVYLYLSASMLHGSVHRAISSLYKVKTYKVWYSMVSFDKQWNQSRNALIIKSINSSHQLNSFV